MGHTDPVWPISSRPDGPALDSAVDVAHVLGVVPVAADADPRGQAVQVDDLVRGQRHLRRCGVLLHALDAPRAGDGDDPRLLGEQPGECNLPRGGALGGCDGLDLVDQCEVVLQRLAGEPGDLGSQVVRGEGGRGVDGAGEEALAEGAERDEPDGRAPR